jgi:hypothetical protein
VRVDIRGVGAGVAAVAAPTGAIFGLRTVAPVLSLGVLYTLAVLLIAIRWGIASRMAAPLWRCELEAAVIERARWPPHVGFLHYIPPGETVRAVLSV